MILVFACVAIAILIVYFLISRNKRLPKIPGPVGLPLVGVGLEVTQENTLQKFHEYANKYGDYFQVQIYGTKFLILNTANAIRLLLTGDAYKRHTNDRALTFYGEKILFNSQSAAFISHGYGDIYGKVRKSMVRGLHFYGEDGRDQFENNIFLELANFQTKLKEFEGQDIPIMTFIQKSLSNVISIALTGERIPEGDSDENLFWELCSCDNYFLGPSTDAVMRTFPWLRFLPGKNKQMFDQAISAKQRIIARYFTAQKATRVPGKPRGIVDSLLDIQDEEVAKGIELVLTDEVIKAQILETAATGVETTWSILSSTILLLLHFPEYQDKLVSEVNQVMVKSRGWKELSTRDKPNCPLFEAVELEAHRLITAVPLGIPRLCNKDTDLNGHLLQNDTSIIVNIWHLHHDDTVWGDPWNFRPERFLGDKGNVIPRDSPLRKSWLPFGIGKRSCLGETFARARYFLYLETLLRHWRFLPSPTQPLGSWDPRHTEAFDCEVTLRPKPYYCRVNKR